MVIAFFIEKREIKMSIFLTLNAFIIRKHPVFTSKNILEVLTKQSWAKY